MLKKWIPHPIRLLIPLLLILVPIHNITSQPPTITLTIAIPDHAISAEVLASFKQQYPDVQVIPVPLNLPPLPSDFIDYPQSADILYVDDYLLSPEVTRAGYLLNLEPLIISDALSVTDDFFPPALSAYQWDGGTWGIPSALSCYDRDAFEQLGLNHPTPEGTFGTISGK